MYNKQVIEHFTNPNNMGALKDFDSEAEGGNPTCGDVVKLQIKLSKDKKKISDIKFKAFGCGACIASTSALTEMVKSKEISKVKKITNSDIADYLGGLPPQKLKCSNFSSDVLQNALKKLI